MHPKNHACKSWDPRSKPTCSFRTIFNGDIRGSSSFKYGYNTTLLGKTMPSARIRRRLRLRDLDTLLTVARCGSMAKAAVELSISQPAVSKAIADMEHTLGVVLFDRLAQGVTPTPSGDALLKSAVAVFDDVRQGLQEIEFLADPTSGVLRIAAGEPMVAGLLPEILRRLHVRYPRLSIDVTMVPAIAQHYRGLRDRHFDLTVGRLVDPMDDDMRAEILFNDQVYIVAGRTNAWCRRRKIDLAELISEPWIIPPRDHLIGSLLATCIPSKGLGNSARRCNHLLSSAQ